MHSFWSYYQYRYALSYGSFYILVYISFARKVFFADLATFHARLIIYFCIKVCMSKAVDGIVVRVPDEVNDQR